ncbi:MAG TPA: acetate--CoA ligase family protein [Beijerinckiaceae bacterium]|jgi:acetyltransferase
MSAENAAGHGVEALLAPRNVVLVGASDRPGHWSGRVWLNLRRFRFAGHVYPVNPNRSEIWGARCYAGVHDLPEAPDHLAVFIPADMTLRTLEEAAACGARGATLFAAGFGEGGDAEGRARGQRLKDTLARTGIAAAGPNCMGVASGRSKLVTLADETLEELAPGPVAVVTQSGMLCGTFSRALNDRGLRVAYLISCGNQTGLTFSDYIAFLAGDPDLRVILCYIESVLDAPRFLAAARKARDNGKRVVVVKIGGSDAARAAALAHTGALAGSIEVFDTFARDAGIIRLDSLDEMIEAAELLARAPAPRGPRIAVMTNSGALKSLTTEATSAHGIEVAKLAPDTESRLRDVLGEDADIGNPLDTKRTLPTEQYMGCVETLCAAPEIDVLLLAEELPREAGIARKVANFRALEKWVGRAGKPVAMFSPITFRETDYMIGLRDQLAHVPLMRDIGKTFRAIAALTKAGGAGPEPAAAAARPAPPPLVADYRRRAAALTEPVALSEVESKALLGAYGIALPPEAIAASPEEATVAATRIGFPVVLKAISAEVPHKSDAGLVVLDLTNGEDVHAAAERLRRRCGELGAAFEGLLVAKQMSGGIEAVLGVHRDPEMGPVVMAGMGGVWLELFKDVAFAPPGLSRERAIEAIARTRVARLLAGYRGSPPGDVNALADAMVSLGRLALDLGDVIEAIDINPVLVMQTGVCALDGLVVLKPPAGGAT